MSEQKKWRVVRMRDQWTGRYGAWVATSGMRFMDTISGDTTSGLCLVWDSAHFSTWREAFDYADELARS